MTIATNIPDLAELIRSLGDICLAVAIIGCIYTLLTTAAVLCFAEQGAKDSGAEPPVTILKPLHGAEPGLQARLAAFCRQNYNAPVQVVCGTQDRASPAAAIVEELRTGFSGPAIELAVDQRCHGACTLRDARAV
jgi:ceramide glucosyltransferase